jgi:hypothetical protein
MRRIAISLFLCFFLSNLVFAETPIAPSPNELAVEIIEIARDTNAVILDLSNLGITELPDEIASLDSVRFLLLGGNKFSSFPIIVTEMTAVETLDLSHNELTSLPPEIGTMTTLQNLHLSANSLTSLPPEIGNLVHLVSLSVDFNQLTSLPPEITELVSLVSLYVNSNQLRELPDDFGNLRSLCNLDISNNQFTKLRTDILELPNLAGEGCGFYSSRNPFEIAGTGQMPPAGTPVPAGEFVEVVITAQAIVTATPEMEIFYEIEEPAPDEGDIEKLLLGGAALLGVLVSFYLGMRWSSDSRKKKPKNMK